MILKDLVPEIKKGKRFRRKIWRGSYRYWQYNIATNTLYNNNGGVMYRKAFGGKIDPFVKMGGDDWEVIEEAKSEI